MIEPGAAHAARASQHFVDRYHMGDRPDQLADAARAAIHHLKAFLAAEA